MGADGTLDQVSPILIYFVCIGWTPFQVPPPLRNPSDGIALASYANESVHLIATHFAAVLGPPPRWCISF